MKKLLITTALSLLFIAPNFAQQRNQKSVQERATQKVSNLDKELSLTDAQKTQLQAYFEQEMEEMGNQRGKRVKERKQMRAEAQELEVKRNGLRERRATQRNSMEERRDSRKEKMKEILTPDQYETWLNSRNESKEDFQRNRGNRSQMNLSSTSEEEGKRNRQRVRGNR